MWTCVPPSVSSDGAGDRADDAQAEAAAEPATVALDECTAVVDVDEDGVVFDAREEFEFARPVAAVRVLNHVHECFPNGGQHVVGQSGVDVEYRQERGEGVTQRLRRGGVREAV